MDEEIRNPYEAWEFPQDFQPRFSNVHIISHSPREFFLTFGVGHPPYPKIAPIVQIALTKEHLMELILNLQAQLRQVSGDQGKDKGR
jgi:hypothetical protein